MECFLEIDTFLWERLVYGKQVLNLILTGEKQFGEHQTSQIKTGNIFTHLVFFLH